MLLVTKLNATTWFLIQLFSQLVLKLVLLLWLVGTMVSNSLVTLLV